MIEYIKYLEPLIQEFPNLGIQANSSHIAGVIEQYDGNTEFVVLSEGYYYFNNVNSDHDVALISECLMEIIKEIKSKRR